MSRPRCLCAHRPRFRPGVCVYLDTRAQHPRLSPPGIPLSKHSGSPTEVMSIPDILHGQMDRGIWPSRDPRWHVGGGSLKPPGPSHLLGAFPVGSTWSSYQALVQATRYQVLPALDTSTPGLRPNPAAP